MAGSVSATGFGSAGAPAAGGALSAATCGAGVSSAALAATGSGSGVAAWAVSDGGSPGSAVARGAASISAACVAAGGSGSTEGAAAVGGFTAGLRAGVSVAGAAAGDGAGVCSLSAAGVVGARSILMLFAPGIGSLMVRRISSGGFTMGKAFPPAPGCEGLPPTEKVSGTLAMSPAYPRSGPPRSKDKTPWVVWSRWWLLMAGPRRRASIRINNGSPFR